jgi:hypothetical protein
MKDVNFISRPSEGNIEHPLDVCALLLARTDRCPRHAAVVVGERVEDHVTLVSLETIWVDDDKSVFFPLAFVDGFGDQLLDQLHLLREQAQDTNRSVRVVRIFNQSRQR